MKDEGRRMNQDYLLHPSSFILHPLKILLNRETRALIERAIADLPLIYRTVLVFADVEGLPNSVIADRLGLRLPAIKSRLHRARQFLRGALVPYFRDLSA
jgi:RNA polymerase sigma-70 factor (ECF subfamily)